MRKKMIFPVAVLVAALLYGCTATAQDKVVSDTSRNPVRDYSALSESIDEIANGIENGRQNSESAAEEVTPKPKADEEASDTVSEETKAESSNTDASDTQDVLTDDEPDSGDKQGTSVHETQKQEPSAGPEVTSEPPETPDNDPESDTAGDTEKEPETHDVTEGEAAAEGSEEKADDSVMADPDPSGTVTETEEESAPPETSQAEPPEDKKAAARAENEKLRKNVWKTTFLAMIPEFTEGTYARLTSDDTFDHAEFTEITGRQAFDDYLSALIGAGFEVDPDTGAGVSTAWYYAQNADGWWVTVDCDLMAGTVKIGSGYRDEETPDNEETMNLIWSTTPLGKLPMPEAGTVESYSSDKKKAYVIFTDFPDTVADDYRKLLKKAGYTVDIDEGKSDGFIWFMAYDDNDGYVELSYSDNAAKISIDLS